MLFNDFLLLARLKRPLITKVLQMVNRTMFNHRQEQRDVSLKCSVQQSPIDWFDSPNANHLYLSVYKSVSLILEERM